MEFEYKFIRLPAGRGLSDDVDERATEDLNALAADGWEPIAIDRGTQLGRASFLLRWQKE